MGGERTNVTLSRPRVASSPRMAPSCAAALEGLLHRGGALEEAREIRADQRRRHESEMRQRRVAAADIRIIQERVR